MLIKPRQIAVWTGTLCRPEGVVFEKVVQLHLYKVQSSAIGPLHNSDRLMFRRNIIGHQFSNSENIGRPSLGKLRSYRVCHFYPQDRPISSTMHNFDNLVRCFVKSCPLYILLLNLRLPQVNYCFWDLSHRLRNQLFRYYQMYLSTINVYFGHFIDIIIYRHSFTNKNTLLSNYLSLV